MIARPSQRHQNSNLASAACPGCTVNFGSNCPPAISAMPRTLAGCSMVYRLPASLMATLALRTYPRMRVRVVLFTNRIVALTALVAWSYWLALKSVIAAANDGTSSHKRPGGHTEGAGCTAAAPFARAMSAGVTGPGHSFAHCCEM